MIGVVFGAIEVLLEDEGVMVAVDGVGVGWVGEVMKARTSAVGVRMLLPTVLPLFCSSCSERKCGGPRCFRSSGRLLLLATEEAKELRRSHSLAPYRSPGK